VPQIIVEREEGSFLDRLRAYRVIIDGVYRGNVRQKEKWSFAVTAGTHTVILRMDYYSSPPVKLAVANRTRLVCRSSLAHALGLLAVMTPGAWIAVHEDEEVPETDVPYPGDVDWLKMAQVAGASAKRRTERLAPRDKRPGALRLSHSRMDPATKAKRSLELDLRDAVTSGALEVRYEPVVDLATRRVVSFEALLRWRHPVLGKVPAADFIPLAENLGLIGAIGQQVLEHACHEAATWPEDVSVAVNISAGQIKDGALAAVVASALHRSGLPANRLILDVAEGVVLRGPAAQLVELEALREIGVRVAVHDFGMAFSSLRNGAQVPADLIKINRLLVSGMTESPDRLATVRATINYCAMLGIPCCAVGVESQQDLSALVAEQCAQAQGHVFGPSLAAREVPGLLARMNPGRPGAVSVATFLPALPFADVVAAANDVVMITSADIGAPGPTIMYVNPAFTRLTGYHPGEVIGLSPRILQGPGTDRATLDAIGAGLRQGRMVNETLVNYTKGGAPYRVELHISPIRDETGRLTHFVSVQRDVSLARRGMVELECVSERDRLTGLPIDRTLVRILQAEIDAAIASPDTLAPPCVAVIEVQDRAQLAAAAGAAAAELLGGIADRLIDNIRRCDTLARIEDGVFAVCMPNIRPREAKALAAGLQSAVAAHALRIGADAVQAKVCFGVASFGNGDSAQSMLERAGRVLPTRLLSAAD
jgi:PAS domain S-box-containing protein